MGLLQARYNLFKKMAGIKNKILLGASKILSAILDPHPGFVSGGSVLPDYKLFIKRVSYNENFEKILDIEIIEK